MSRLFKLMAPIAWLGMTGPAAAQIVFEDSSFALGAWQSAKVYDDTRQQTASFSAFPLPLGGNPGAYRRASHTLEGGTIYVAHINTRAAYRPQQQGPVVRVFASFDARCFGQLVGVAYYPALRQDDSYYVGEVARTVTATAWQHFEYFSIQDYEFRRIAGSGPASPDFSANGRRIEFGYMTANTTVPPQTKEHGLDNWRLEINPERCYPDCDTSTGAGTLDIFDFICFQNAFARGEPYACDCESLSELGVCDVFDFLCFQNEFTSGCP